MTLGLGQGLAVAEELDSIRTESVISPAFDLYQWSSLAVVAVSLQVAIDGQTDD